MANKLADIFVLFEILLMKKIFFSVHFIYLKQWRFGSRLFVLTIWLYDESGESFLGVLFTFMSLVANRHKWIKVFTACSHFIRIQAQCNND